MGSSGQLYSLSWGEFSSSLASAVQLLRGHGDLVDVTLAAGGRSFPAHKIVLCAASPFLLDLLKSTPCQHPVVMLAGIGADDLESLLEFVYRGEVSVEPSQLPSLLQAAHCLCIHGLTPPTILTENGEEIPASAIPTASDGLSRETLSSYFPLKRRKKRRKSSSSSGKWARTCNTVENEHKAVDGHDNNRATMYDHKDEDAADHGDDIGPKVWADFGTSRPSTLFRRISIGLATVRGATSQRTCSALMELILGDRLSKARSMSDQPASCPLCGAILRQSRNLRRHLELLHFGLGNSNSGMHARYRRAGRNNDLHRASLESVRLSQTARMDHGRLSESSDFPTMTPLSTASSTSNVSHSVMSNETYAGNLSGSSTSAVVTSEQSGHPVTDVASTSCTASMAPPSNSMYSTDSVLSCLLPSLPSLPPFSTSHDVFRHGEILRAGIAYHDSTRQHSRHMQRTDVT